MGITKWCAVPALLLVSCLQTTPHAAALGRLRPTPPAAPHSASDTVLALALREAIGMGGVAAEHQVVLRQVDHLSAAALPAVDSISFYILDSAAIHALAARAGGFTFLHVGSVKVDGDSLQVPIAVFHACNLDCRSFRYDRGCRWVFRQRFSRWESSGQALCLVS